MLKNRFKIIVLVLVCIMTFTGCTDSREYPLIDAEKAGQVALEYMNSKYNAEFELVSSKKNAYYFLLNEVEAYVMSEFTVKGDNSGNTYKVKLCLNEDDQSIYDIVCDNYMNSITIPLLKEKMDNILGELQIPEYITSVSESDRFFERDFPVLNEQDTLKEFAYSCRLIFDYEVTMPESSYYEDINEDIKKIFNPYFSDDYIRIGVAVYTDDYYNEYKKAIINNVMTPECSKDDKVCCYTIKIET